MEADARAEIFAHRPLLLDEDLECGVVGIRHVLLEAERRRDEVDLHPERFAEREHDGGRLGRRETGQLVDREFAEIGAAGVGREQLRAGGGVFLVAALHLLQRRPDVGEKLGEVGFVEREAGLGDACLHRRDEIGGHVGGAPRTGVVGDLGLREFGRKVERDVAREHAARDERVFAVVELTTDRLVIGVERPCDAARMKAGLQLREHAAVAHAFDALALVTFRDVGADKGERHAVEFAREHHVGVVNEFTRNGVLVGGDTDT